MSVLDQLKNLTPWDITAVLGSFLATIAPGFLIIHLFNPELIIQLEVFVFCSYYVTTNCY